MQTVGAVKVNRWLRLNVTVSRSNTGHMRFPVQDMKARSNGPVCKRPRSVGVSFSLRLPRDP